LNFYNVFDMPRMYYFISYRATSEGTVAQSSADKIPLRRAWWTMLVNLDASSNKIVQALGVRFVIHRQLEGEEQRSPPDSAILRLQLGPTTVGGRKFSHTIYEFNDFNMGNYSPTSVIIARDAPSILRHLWRTSFNPRQSIVLPEGIEGLLVEATGGKMSFERGAIRVQAESRGRSLLLLPMQYSHCLVLSEPAKGRLLPANLVQTALLFQGSIDVRIHLEYGVFRPGCRKQDLADLPELGILADLPESDIFDEKDPDPVLTRTGTYADQWAQLHPYAISTVADLPRALGAVVKKLATSKTIIGPQIVTICDGYICIGGPDSAPYGTGGTVSWGIPGGAQGCAVGSPTSPSTLVSTSGSAPTGPLYEESTFALSCLDPQGDVHRVQLNIVVPAR
jgi:hypothetical protein